MEKEGQPVAIEQIKMPQLGESVTEGTISKWLVSVGDKVNKYDPLAEVMTDKVNAEVPSSFSGTIKELIANEGDTFAVGEIICTIEIEGGSTEDAPAAEKPAAEASTGNAAPAVSGNDGNRARYSPAVLKLAQEHNIDLTIVNGTGAGGRITRKDLQQIIQSGNIPQPSAEAPKAQAAAQTEAPAKPAAPSQPAASAPEAPSVPVAADSSRATASLSDPRRLGRHRRVAV